MPIKDKPTIVPEDTDDIEIVSSKGTPGKGGRPDGESWVVFFKGERAGKAYINMQNDPVRGLHPSFHIFLNRKSQGKHIGRHVYKACCSNSKYNTIYAHMRKSNIASRKAAKYAGFVDATTQDDLQLVMVWHKPNCCH